MDPRIRYGRTHYGAIVRDTGWTYMVLGPVSRSLYNLMLIGMPAAAASMYRLGDICPAGSEWLAQADLVAPAS